MTRRSIANFLCASYLSSKTLAGHSDRSGAIVQAPINPRHRSNTGMVIESRGSVAKSGSGSDSVRSAITASNPLKWRHYPGDIILWCVQWYLRFPISFAHMAEMALERGLFIHPSCIWRWVQIYGPELDKRCRVHLKPTNKSYRVDETYIRIKGRDRFLYRAVDSARAKLSTSCSRPKGTRQQP